MNTEIGTISHLLVPCFRTVQLPNSMMGFYPVTPGLAEYQIGSPVFTKVTMHLDGGVDFVLSAPAATADAKYWEKATLGGKPLVGTVLPHAAILSGQTLKLEMHE